MNDFGTRVRSFGDRTAIIDLAGAWTYAQLSADASRLAGALLDGADDLHQARVVVLCTPGHDYVTALLACWEAGAIAVPIHPDHPEPEQAYVVENSESAIVVTSPAHAGAAGRLAEKVGGRAVAVDAGAAPEPPCECDPRVVRSSSTRAARPVGRRASSTRTAHCSRRSPAWSTRGSGRPTTASCSCCRCTTCTAS